MLKTHSIRICFGHDETHRVWVSNAAAARTEARLYMRLLAPTEAWQPDDSPNINMSMACVKDTQGFYLWTVDVWPKLAKPLTK